MLLGHGLAVTLLVLASAPADVANGMPVQGFNVHRVEWTGAVEPGQLLSVTNPFGDLRLRFGGYQGQVEIQGAIQQLRSNVPVLELSASRDAHGHVSLSVEQPATASEPETGVSFEVAGRADLVVFVPEGTPVTARTTHGVIDAKGVRSGIDLASDAGSITLKSIMGPIRAMSVSGHVSVVLEPLVHAGPQSLETVTGDISVFVGDDANLAVSAATSGEFCTEFSIEIAHRPLEEPNKAATLVFGAGEQHLTINSKRGRIRLRRRPGTSTPGTAAP